MKTARIQEFEIRLLMEALRLRHGYDFSNYAEDSLKRRIRSLPVVLGSQRISDLIPRLLHDEISLASIISALSVGVSTMFRDPPVFRAIREHICPKLSSYPSIVIWHAGCATGEEIYSLAILLAEENLLKRCRIYATDIDDLALDVARDGHYSHSRLVEFERNYKDSGGTRALRDYCTMDEDVIEMNEFLKKSITFAHHNLVSDGVFCEVHLILCRNVLIYFNSTLQDKVFKLFYNSLVRGGFLFLGPEESPYFSPLAEHFKTVSRARKIFQCPLQEHIKARAH